MKDVTVIIPTFNEEENISKLIDSIKALSKDIKVIVADDGSTDNTQKIIKKKDVHLLDRSKEKIKGLTASVIDAAKLVETRYIIVMDADFQHPPRKIKDIADALADNDIVIASRKKIKKWPLKRRIISNIATILGKIRLSLNQRYVNDPMSGFFGVKTILLQKVISKYEDKIEKQGYKILFDTLKYCGKAKISEIHYEFQERNYGTSKIGKKQAISYLKSLFK